MYKRTYLDKSEFRINNSVQGETIEQKVERILNNGEPIS